MKNHITSKEVEKEKNTIANYERLVVLKSFSTEEELYIPMEHEY